MMQIDRFPQAQARTQARMSRARAARYLSSTALATLIALGAGSVAQAQQSNWVAGAGNYGTAGNWDNNNVPDVPAESGVVSGLGSAANVAAPDTFTPGSLTVENGGAVSVNGQLGTALNPSGVTVNQGGGLSVNGGVQGNVFMAGPGSAVTINNGGTLTGNATVNRGTLNNDGAITGGIDTTGGNSSVTVTVGATGTVSGPVGLGAGTLNSSGALNGGLSVGNGATANINAGSVNGGTTVGLGTLNIIGGTLDVVTLNGGQNGGVVNNSGGIVGTVTANNGVFTTTNVVTGNLTQNGGVVNAQGTIGGDVTVNGGDFNVTGALGGINNVTNSGRIRIGNAGVLNFVSMENSGRVGLGAGPAGDILAVADGDVIGSAGSTFDLQNGAAEDGMLVNGAVSGTNTIAIDVDLTQTNIGTGVTGTGADGFAADIIEGDVTINVDAITDNGVFTLQQNAIPVVIAQDGFGANLTEALTGNLPQGPTGLVIFRTTRGTLSGGEEAISIESDINPAIGGVAAAFSSVQNVVGTVVNRPSGAYVSGIAFDSPNNCSTGIWGRTIGGRVNTDSETTNALGTKVGSSGQLDYAGLQGGADFGCFEAFDGGWDISGGLLAGAATGEFLEKASGLRTTGDFDQYFLGGYVAAAKGNWSGEMQLRYGNTDFTLDNPNLAVRDADTSVDSYALSGSVTYRQDLAPGLALLPSVGFNVTDSDSASVALTNPGGTRVGTLTVEDHTSLTGFLGATLSRTTVNEAAGSATNAFLTGTYYIDGSDERDTTVTVGTPATGTATTSLSTSETGDFAELSAGGSIVRLLGNSGSGGVRQVNYSVRVDARYGDDLDGVGITGQVRYQF